MVAGRSPDEAQSILTPAVEAMVETVRVFGGTLNQVLGDGVMALFGAPLSQEDHALLACCAAFKMHEAVSAVRFGQIVSSMEMSRMKSMVGKFREAGRPG